MRLLLGRQMLLLAQIAHPFHGIALSLPRVISRKRQTTWKLVEGTIEHVSVLVPDGFPEPYRWTIEVTYSYNHDGEYFSGSESRTLLRRNEADEFLAVLGNYSTADAVSDNAGSERVEELSVRASKNNVDVLVRPDHPEKAIIAGFLEGSQVFAAHVKAPVHSI